jgi:hypothetical protein
MSVTGGVWTRQSTRSGSRQADCSLRMVGKWYDGDVDPSHWSAVVQVVAISSSSGMSRFARRTLVNPRCHHVVSGPKQGRMDMQSASPT